MCVTLIDRVQQRRGLHDAALEAAAAAAASDPRSAAAHNNHGVLLAALSRHEEAVDVFATGLRVDATDVELLVNFGVSTAELGQLQIAAKVLEIALELEPTHARARADLAAIQQMPVL